MSGEVEKTHEQKETLSVDVFEPGHDPRTVTATFRDSKRELEHLFTNDDARCFICNANAAEAGEPLEAHHVVIERCFANGVDWDLVKAFFGSGEPEVLKSLASSTHPMLQWIHRLFSFDWENFDPKSEKDTYDFIDNMMVNGLMLCKKHHTGKDEGIHDLPFPIYIFQKFARPGYKFSRDEVIHFFT